MDVGNLAAEQSDVAAVRGADHGLDKGEPTCIGFAGLAVDEAVTKEILRVVQPAAIEAATMASLEQSCRVDEVVAALQRDLQAARYSAQRAQNQYDLADPAKTCVPNTSSSRLRRLLGRTSHA